MLLTIPRNLNFKVPYLFLVILVLVSFIPVKHEVHCKPLLFVEECPTETIFLGKLVVTHIFMVFYQIFTFELSFLFSETLSVLLYFLAFFVVGNFILNLFLGKLSLSSESFLKKSININFWLVPNKTFLVNFFLLMFSVVFFLFFSEIVFRTFHEQNLQRTSEIESLRLKDPTFGGINRPSLSTTIIGENNYPINVKHNSLGLRSSYELGEKVKKRILLIGDSFIYGEGLSQNETLDYFLQRELGDKFEIINAGVLGYGATQEFLYLKKIYDVIKPDIVILAIYHNDFKENIFPKKDGSSVAVLNLAEGNFLVNLLQNSSKKSESINSERKTLFWLNDKFSGLKSFFSNKFYLFKFITMREFKDNILSVKYEPYWYNSFVFSNKTDNKIVNLLFKGECVLLKEFNSFFKEKNIPYIFFYIPDKLEIEQWRIKPTFDGFYGSLHKEPNLERPLKELYGCTETNNISFFSLKDTFLKVKDDLYNKYGGHWSPKATNLTAQLLKEELVRRGVIS